MGRLAEKFPFWDKISKMECLSQKCHFWAKNVEKKESIKFLIKDKNPKTGYLAGKISLRAEII